ncbi:MAG: HlyD family efflux transporter periplasmic adaptor subunit [Streptococcaceae bacterium]|nr:HlyD family efflux transporter periplasmic adaptor subunit [Streptococcaceae bacterium]
MQRFKQKKLLIIILSIIISSVLIISFLMSLMPKEKVSESYRLYTVKTVAPLVFKGVSTSKEVNDYYLDNTLGTLQAVNVKNGQEVHAGDVLLSYRNDTINQQATTDRFALKQAEETLQNAQADLGIAQGKKDKLSEKFSTVQSQFNSATDDDQKAALSTQIESLEEQLSAADDGVTQANRSIQSAGNQVEAAKSTLSQTESQTTKQVLAEQDGLAIVDETSTTKADDPLVRIVNQSVYIEGIVSEFDYAKLQTGQSVTIQTLNLDEQTTGEITDISALPLAAATTDTTQSTANYQFTVQPNEAVQYGYHVQITLPQKTIVLPKQTVLHEGSEYFVFIYQDGVVTQQAVKVTATAQGYQLISGLKPKQRIIENPTTKLKDNQKVEITK